ncbi:hypothetical protein GLOIN_2v1776609 [Rhizophagus irregularis DAOM 181602=DAOM 197198]|nr:hypothetical protein GLOIN_2v1776609 [Rhizophagus irregularis DAOM 181602=DAOM 197198]
MTDLKSISITCEIVFHKLESPKKKTIREISAVIYNIPEEMIMATLWAECKPTTFLIIYGASIFKIIQTSKSIRNKNGQQQS